MKQEHEMTPGVLISGDDMSAGDYKARCAVLEAELAELRGRVEQEAKVFWVLFDNTGGEKYIKKDADAGTLAFFDNEEDAARAKRFNLGTDYMRVEYYTAPQPASVERVDQDAVSYYERAHGKKSPTHGMSLDERIAHVGGRTNTAGYIEFDNVMAVSALIDHVLRDSPAPRPAPTAAQDVAGLLNRIVPRIDAGGPNPINPDIHCCEWTLHKERERIHAEFADALARQGNDSN